MVGGNSTQLIGTTGLVLSQMSFTCVGTLLNNLLLITLKDLPDISGSTYHVLLANIAVTNLFTCTVLKPASAVYIAYAYAKVRWSNIFDDEAVGVKYFR